MKDKKTVILTGASSGIGFFIAKQLDKHYKLILISRTESKLKQCSESLSHKHVFYSIDVSDIRQVEQFYNDLIINNDKIFGLINCAGIFGGIGTLDSINPKDFRKGFEVNFYGSYLMSYFVLKLYSQKGLKKIINFAGGGAAGPFPRYSSYACSKTALVKLTENIAIEFPQVDCNIIAPGFIKTNLAQQTLDAGRDKAGIFYDKTLHMIKKGGQSISKVIGLIDFLLSAESDGITGKFISAQWDIWDDKKFQERLRQEVDLCTLRRIDEKYFTLKESL